MKKFCMNDEEYYYYSLLAFLLVLLVAASDGASYVEEACKVTRYPQQCVEKLASFSEEAKRSPSKWARAGVSVTIAEVKDLSSFLGRIKRSRWVSGRTVAAISDCVEVVDDALDYLHQSLYALRTLNPREFEGQVNNVLTWLSTVVTDEDTCIEGLEEAVGSCRRSSERIVRRMVVEKVTNASYVTSNALALTNNLATTSAYGFNNIRS
ncbi:hypothetical protein V2J09_009254 [Rumex salicifolius]